jgi:hypothetical protein
MMKEIRSMFPVGKAAPGLLISASLDGGVNREDPWPRVFLKGVYNRGARGNTEAFW